LLPTTIMTSVEMHVMSDGGDQGAMLRLTKLSILNGDSVERLTTSINLL
jgi:folate-dependent phosphoribosylglycinamide formyltransferase PurN